MVNLRRLGQRLVHRRGQPCAQREAVTLAVLEALDAKLLFAGRYRRLVHAIDGDERREIRAAAGQFFGELEAGARRNGVGVDRVIEQAEAVLAAQAFILAAQIGGLADLEREPHRIERAAPLLAVGERAAEHAETVGLLAAVLRALIGDVSRGRGAIEQQRALAVVARPDLQHGAGKAEPVRAVVRRGGDELAEHDHAGAEILLLEGGVGVAAQLRRRCLVTVPASLLICASSLSAASSRSLFW